MTTRIEAHEAAKTILDTGDRVAAANSLMQWLDTIRPTSTGRGGHARSTLLLFEAERELELIEHTEALRRLLSR